MGSGRRGVDVLRGAHRASTARGMDRFPLGSLPWRVPFRGPGMTGSYCVAVSGRSFQAPFSIVTITRARLSWPTWSSLVIVTMPWL